MMRVVGRRLLVACMLMSGWVSHAAEAPDCSRPYSLALHEHGLLYAGQTGEGIDKDVADELARRSGCRIAVSVMPRSRIWQLIDERPGREIVVDLEARTVTVPGDGGDAEPAFQAPIGIDDYTRWRLLEGLDDIGLTLRNEDKIAQFEARRESWRPRTLPVR